MRQWTTFLGIALLLLGPVYGTESLDTARYENKIRLILDDVLAMTNGGDPSDRVHDAVSTSLEQLRSGRASKYLDPEEHGLLSGMKFTYQRDNAAFGLSFGPEFLDSYTPQSSTHLAILVHEMWHLRDFVKQHDDFSGAEAGSRTKFWYELDAFHVEAEFIRDYLQKARPLTRFDRFVLQSYESDGLDSVAVLLHQQSSKVFFHFLDIDQAFHDDARKGPDLVEQIAREGKERVDAYNAIPAEKDFESYFAYRGLISFRSQMLKTLPLLLQNPSMTWDSVFQTYPGIDFVYRESVRIEEADRDRQTAYRKGIVIMWEAELAPTSSPLPVAP